MASDTKYGGFDFAGYLRNGGPGSVISKNVSAKPYHDQAGALRFGNRGNDLSGLTVLDPCAGGLAVTLRIGRNQPLEALDGFGFLNG